MINYVTVHYLRDDWIPIQTSYIKRYTNEDYRIWSCFTRIGNEYDNLFYKIIRTQIKPHATKLDILANEVLGACSDDEVIVFMDGDAFPVNNYVDFVKDKISIHKLVAVRRDEFFGEPIPHPCFCATTVGFWREIGGTWEKGNRSWRNTKGNQRKDVGGYLYFLLQELDINWYPLLRTYNMGESKTSFAIYNNMIYHHFAGFRRPYIKDQENLEKEIKNSRAMFEKIKIDDRFFERLLNDF